MILTAGAESLAGVLVQCTALAHLNLWSNNIRDAGIESIAGVLPQCAALVSLDLGDNKGEGLQNGGVARLARVLRVQDAGSESGESQVPGAEMLSTPGTLNIVHYAYQYGSDGHYESIVSTKVRFSIDA
jgi:hypothetical protein